MRRLAPVAFLAVAAIGLASLVAVAAFRTSSLAFTLGVVPKAPVAKVVPRHVACQRWVTTEADFAAVRLSVGAFRRGRLAVILSPAEGGAPISSGGIAVARGRSDRVVKLDREVPKERRVTLCVRNEADGVLALYGGSAEARAGTALYLDNRNKRSDLTLVFLRRPPRSTLSQVPEILARASLFRPRWVGAWTFYLVLLLVGVGVPGLIFGALWNARDAAETLNR